MTSELRQRLRRERSRLVLRRFHADERIARQAYRFSRPVAVQAVPDGGAALKERGG